LEGESEAGIVTRRSFLKILGGSVGAGLVVTYPILIERNLVLVNRYRIPVSHLPAAFDGFTVAHLTDLHMGRLVSDAFVHGVVERTNRLGAEIIVCTGDFVHKRRNGTEIELAWRLLSKLEARQGVFSVLGNHDHWVSTSRSRYWLRRSGQDLSGKRHCFTQNGDRLWLIGAGDLWEDFTPLDPLLAGIPDGECRVVLAHNPDSADTRYSERVDLMISGHTHGGQVCIPFFGAPVLPVKNKTYSSGLKSTPKGYPIFISRGIGWTIYPVRFNCYPEIAVLTFTRAIEEGAEKAHPCNRPQWREA
jgi:uncharacterized protein